MLLHGRDHRRLCRPPQDQSSTVHHRGRIAPVAYDWMSGATDPARRASYRPVRLTRSAVWPRRSASPPRVSNADLPSALSLMDQLPSCFRAGHVAPRSAVPFRGLEQPDSKREVMVTGSSSSRGDPLNPRYLASEACSICRIPRPVSPAGLWAAGSRSACRYFRLNNRKWQAHCVREASARAELEPGAEHHHFIGNSGRVAES